MSKMDNVDLRGMPDLSKNPPEHYERLLDYYRSFETDEFAASWRAYIMAASCRGWSAKDVDERIRIRERLRQLNIEEESLSAEATALHEAGKLKVGGRKWETLHVTSDGLIEERAELNAAYQALINKYARGKPPQT